MKKCISNKYVLYILGIVLSVAVWQVFSDIIDQKVMLLPGPFESLKNAIYQLSKPYTLECIWASLVKLMIGYGVALAAAMLFGVIAGNNRSFYYLVEPLMVFLRSVPTASLVYLFIVLAGFKKAPVCLVFLVCFPVLYEAVSTAVENVDNYLKNISAV